jgi:branched-chain amino acid transport system ATP-binding protein
MLKLINISTEYDGVPMLRDINLHIEESSLTCLLGSNGSGKTTLVKAILGLVKPATGKILFEGIPINCVKTNRIVKMGVSVVPEGRRLFPKMTVLENMTMGCFHSKDKKVVQEGLKKVFCLFPQLEEKINQIAGTLSGGEQSMVSIGRAIMGEPKILLLDEPSLGLSPKLVEEFFDTIQRINRKEGITILLIEQNALKALSISDRGYVLQKGRILAGGDRKELLNSDVVKKAYLS